MKTKSCSFETKRLLVKEWHSLSVKEWKQQELKDVVSKMLTPQVTKSLPPEWRGFYSEERAQSWINNRDSEGATLLVIEKSSKLPVGLVILFEIYDEENNHLEIRLGYLLAESIWGKGIASELIQGFVEWCRRAEIGSIVGGVEQGNIASRRVLEKNGFVCDAKTSDAEEQLFELILQSTK